MTSPACRLPVDVGCEATATQTAWSFGKDSFGSWVLGQKNDTFVFQPLVAERPAMVLSPDKPSLIGHWSNPAPSDWTHKGSSTRVLQLGQWFIGPKDKDHFVINTPPTTGMLPQLLLRQDGGVFRQGPTLPLPGSWTFTANSHTVTVGSYQVGPTDTDDNAAFVVSRSGKPMLWLTTDAKLYLAAANTAFFPDAACNLQLDCDGTSGYRGENPLSCTPVSVCSVGQQQLMAPSPTNDRLCESCPVGTFADKPGTKTCADWTQCGSAEFQDEAGTATQDRSCATCFTCPSGHTESEPCGLTSDRQCAGCAVCKAGVTFTASNCTENIDTVCEPCTDCLALAKFTTLQCRPSHNAHCIEPPSCDYSLQFEQPSLTATTNRVCRDLTTCPPGAVETRAPTISMDRQWYVLYLSH